MPSTISVRSLEPVDRMAWEPLWFGYNAFYERPSVPEEITETAWARFMAGDVPMYALGAFDGARLVGIAHYLFHYSTTAVAQSCYLQDLFTAEDTRGRGIGRVLIDAVYAAARAAGAGRVYWQTHETNHVAMQLYDRIAEKSGFLVYRKPLSTT